MVIETFLLASCSDHRGVSPRFAENRRRLRSWTSTMALAVAIAAGAQPAQATSFQVTIENPGLQETTTTFSSAGVENFNSYTSLAGLGAQTISTNFSGTVGSYNLISGLSATISNVYVTAASQYGGAGGTGYFAADYQGGATTSITIALSQNVNYFGIWISAMNSGNTVSLYSGSTLLYSFDTATMASLIASNTAYYGNPTTVYSGLASGEPFAFVNFYDISGTFDKIIISGTGFESDNYTVGSYLSQSGTAAGQSAPGIVSSNNGTNGYNTVSTLGTGNYSLKFDGGTLLVDRTGTVSSSFSITGNNGHIDQNSAASVFSGLFSNSTVGVDGMLVIQNSGTGGSVTLTNTGNSYSGGTQVEAGANLVIASASVIGTGGLYLVGTATTPATLTTTATMTIANAITVTGDPVFNVASGTVTTVSSAITGTGDVVVSGGGTLELTAANTYTGATIIDSGSILALTGSGSISASSAVTNNGTFTVSSASTIVALGGSFSQSSTGSLLLSASPSALQKLTVAGVASLDGTLTLTASAGKYSIGKYYLLTADGGVSGQFSAFSNNLASVTALGYLLGYDATGVYLYLAPNSSATLQGIQRNAQALNSVINSRAAALQAGLSHDCTKFNAHNMCVSVGGRYTRSEGGSARDNQAGFVVLGYRPTERVRLGVFVDQSVDVASLDGVREHNSSPMWGLFGNWAMNENGLGLNVQASAAFASSRLAIGRWVSDYTEAGLGHAPFGSQAYQVQANYVEPVSDSTALIPYIGLRYMSMKIGGYSEADGSQVLFPVTYNSANQRMLSAIGGVGVSSRLADDLTGTLSAGVVQNLDYKMGGYTGTSNIPGLTSFKVRAPDHTNTLATISAGVAYDIDSDARVVLSATWQQQPFVNANTTSTMVSYSVGF